MPDSSGNTQGLGFRALFGGFDPQANGSSFESFESVPLVGPLFVHFRLPVPGEDGFNPGTGSTPSNDENDNQEKSPSTFFDTTPGIGVVLLGIAGGALFWLRKKGKI